MLNKHRWLISLAVCLLVGCSSGFDPVAPTPAPGAVCRAPLAPAAGGGLQVHQTDHFILLCSADGAFVDSTGQFLEQVYDTFYSSFKDAGFSPRPATEKLTCVCLNSYSEMDAYGKAADGAAVSWMDGYYSYRTNRVTVVRVGNSSASRGRGASAAGEGLNIRTTSHEVAHLLAFNSGLQNRDVTYPFWLTEGLATNFEADRSGTFGLAPKNPCHRQRLAAARAAGRLLPLSEFLGMTAPPAAASQSIYEAYAQAWGLFNYLLQCRRPQLKEYMADLASSWPLGQDSRWLTRRFVNAFGPVEPLERDFLRYIDQMAR